MAEREEEIARTRESEELTVIVMGSKSDRPFADKIKTELKDRFGIPALLRIASAHKQNERVRQIVQECEPIRRLVWVAIAGGSNGLGPILDPQTSHPVISSPPIEVKDRDPWQVVDVFSSIRIPSGVGASFILGPEQTALSVAKIFANGNDVIADKIRAFQAQNRGKNEGSDSELLLEQKELVRRFGITG